MKRTHKFNELHGVDGIVASAPNLTAAARALGVDRSTLHRWLRAGKVRPPARARRRARGRQAVAVRLQTLLDRFEAALDRLEQIGCDFRYVSRIREDARKDGTCPNLPSRVTGKDGKSYPATTEKALHAPSAPLAPQYQDEAV